MAATNPTTTIAALETMLGSTSLSGTIYYPTITWSSVSAPCNLLQEHDTSRKSIGYGVAGVPTGAIDILMYRTGAIGTIERERDTVASELLNLTPGLIIDSIDSSFTIDRQKGDTGEEVFVAQMTIYYGVN